MARGAAASAGAEVGLSSTGIAGPDGGTKEKPVGLVFLGCFVQGQVTVKKCLFTGNRAVSYTHLDVYKRQVQDPALRQKISEMNRKVAGSNSDPYYGAPTIILVLADGTHPNFIQDCSCVLANLMNAAYAAGLGSCWINRELEMFDSPEGKALLAEWGLPENFRGVGACALGYPDQELPEPKARKDGYVIRK